MKKLLLAAGIGMCIFTMATTDTNAGSYEYKDLTQDTTPKKKDKKKDKDTTQKQDSLTIALASPIK
jgi:hypothetical protein